MIYKDILSQNTFIIRPIVEKLLDTALKKQTHPSDFYLIMANGYYDKQMVKFEQEPYVIGGDLHYTAAQSFSNYIKWYLDSELFTATTKVEINYPDPKLEEIKISVHNEKGIYLRFWEADSTLKYLYQISRLCAGLHYDWHWQQMMVKLPSRQSFLEEIINSFLAIDAGIVSFFNETSVRQIRNAIAHSQYCLLNNDIKYLNYSDNPKKKANIMLLKYSEWERIIHSTIIFGSELMRGMNQINSEYQMLQGKAGKMQVRVYNNKDAVRYYLL